MCKASDGKLCCEKNELIQLLKKKKRQQNSNVTLCSSAQKKQLPDCHQVTSLFSTAIGMARYKTGEPVHLHNFSTEVEVVEVVGKHMGGAASIKRDSPASRKDQSRGPAPLFFCRLHSPLPVKGELPSGLSQQNQAGLPVLGSWRQQQMANRQSKLIKPPNVLRFGFQIR